MREQYLTTFHVLSSHWLSWATARLSSKCWSAEFICVQVSSLPLSDMSTTAWVYILSISLASVTLIIIMLLVIIIRRRRMRKLQENCPIPYFIELGPPASGDKTEHQLISSPSRASRHHHVRLPAAQTPRPPDRASYGFLKLN